MKTRIAATLAVLALWLVFWLTFAGNLPAIAAYTEELRSTSVGDSVMQTLMSEHMRLPAVVSFMILAVLWAPVIESKLNG